MAIESIKAPSLLEAAKIEPMKVFVGFSNTGSGVVPIVPSDATPYQLSVKRAVAIMTYMRVIGRIAPKVPPALTGVIAGGVLAQSFNAEQDVIGALVSFDAGDQTPVGQMTLSLTYLEDAVVPATITQTYTWQVNGKNSKVFVLCAANSNEIAMPLVAHIGAGNPMAFAWTGPNGFAVSTELLNSKHPLVRELANSDLYERLIRFELKKSGGM